MTYGDVELGATDVVAGVGGLHDHSFALDGIFTGEGELVAGAAARVGGSDGREAVGEVFIHSPGGLGGAHEGCSTGAAGLGDHAVGEGLILDVAGFDRGGKAGPGPGTGWFAAVP